ncbi:uncharacterized protein LOC113472366, partial [Diaphorina citri]|uniref:Uncharacterized protein LOC113472366 n=1 Tax=Diaphorina citri TaxID=121845 RepID=A0A3Q0JHK1_DIACI
FSDNESTLQYNNTKEIENATCLPLSYVLRFYTNKVKVEEDADDIVPNGHSTAVPVLPHHNVIKIQSPPPPPVVTTQLPSPSIVPAVSSSPQGSELGEDLEEENMLEDSNDSWTLAEEYSSEYILKHGSKMTTPVDGNVEKPFACPVPGCKKRYKNVNGIKYHSKNGHKTDGRAPLPPPPPVLLYPWTSSSTNSNTSEVTLPPSPLPVIPNSRKSRPSGKGRTRKVTAPIDGTSSKVGKITASNDGLSSKVGKSGNTPLNDGISSKFGKSGNIPLSGGISSQVGKLTNAPTNDGTSSAGFSSLIPQGNVSPNEGIFSQVGNLTSPPEWVNQTIPL